MGLLNYKKLGHTKELRLSEDFYDYFNIQKGKNPIKRNLEYKNKEKDNKEEQGNSENKLLEQADENNSKNIEKQISEKSIDGDKDNK
jgi:hypothetical protein